MHSLTYVSSAVNLFTQEDLRALLAKSRLNNDRAGITGLLLYKDGNFMQVLEGDRAAVLATKAKIAADPRHRGVLVLLEEDSAQRHFGNWSMAFRDLETGGTQALPGYSDFLNTSLTDPRFKQDPNASRKLLRIFKESM